MTLAPILIGIFIGLVIGEFISRQKL